MISRNGHLVRLGNVNNQYTESALGRHQEDSDKEEKESCCERVFPGGMYSRGGRVAADEDGVDAETN